MDNADAQWTVFFVRHGQTDGNARGIYQGSTDAPLNRQGKEQAREAGRLLEEEKLEVVVTSDLQRARHTAEIIARKQRGPVEIHHLPDLREIDFGPWEGLAFDQVKRQHPGELKALLEDPLNSGPSGMETLAQLERRVAAAWEKVLAEFYPRPLAVVAHGGPLRALIARWRGQDFLDVWSNISLPNGGVNRVVFDGEEACLEIPWGYPLPALSAPSGKGKESSPAGEN